MRYIATSRDLKGPPWRSDSELAMIRDWFYPQHIERDVYSARHPDMRQRAISKINLYLFKAGGIPHAMVATASLTEALIHDDQLDRQKYISHSAMASVYSMALVKFVNGFVDRDVAKATAASLSAGQTDQSEHDDPGATTLAVKGGGDNSMYAYAVKIGLPEIFVDLRHEIVHGRIPELSYLREIAEKGLEWLWQKWWLKNATGDPARALQEIQLRKQGAEGHQNMMQMVDDAPEMADSG